MDMLAGAGPGFLVKGGGILKDLRGVQGAARNPRAGQSPPVSSTILVILKGFEASIFVDIKCSENRINVQK